MVQRWPVVLTALVATCAALWAAPGRGQSAPSEPLPEGVWMRDGGTAAIELFGCGGELCGRLVWGRPDLWPADQVHQDSNNPDPALRNRSLCGLPVLWGLRQEGDGAWAGGRVYDPESGSTYDAKLQVLGPDEMRVHAFRQVTLLGKTQIWHPAPPHLVRCDRG